MKTIIFDIGIYNKGTLVYLIKRLFISEKDLNAYIAVSELLLTLMDQNFISENNDYLAFDYSLLKRIILTN